MGIKKINPMDNEQKDLTPEEEEQVAIQAPKEDEVRANIIEEFGFDEEIDADTIDKLVAKEVAYSHKLSAAIGQKIKYREKAKAIMEKPPESKKPEVKIDDDDLDKKLDARLEQRDLDNLDFSDNLKNEIKRVAEIRGVSIKEAQRDPYIVSKIEDYKTEQRTDEASITRTNISKGKQKFTFDNPPDVDMATEEGRKIWEDYKTQMAKEGY